MNHRISIKPPLLPLLLRLHQLLQPLLREELLPELEVEELEPEEGVARIWVRSSQSRD